ncbi:50S ribosomal protein L10, partial [archaeon]
MSKEEKMEAVVELKKTLDSYPVVGIVDVKGFPSKQLQKIKKNLRGKAVIAIVKKT